MYHFMKLPSAQRNRNIKVRVWKTENGETRLVGEKHRNTASWKGANTVAQQVIAEEENFTFEGYNIQDAEIELKQLYTGELP